MDIDKLYNACLAVTVALKPFCKKGGVEPDDEDKETISAYLPVWRLLLKRALDE